MNRLTKQEQIEYINGYLPANIHDIFATGGGIHIKPSHEGRFTEYKQRTGKTTEEALHSPDPHVRQMANFARNASHWKHQEGGTATGQQEQMTQLIQMYAQFVAQQSGQDPNQVYQQLMQQLQDLKPKELQKAVQQMSTELQSAQQQSQAQGAPQGQEQENPEEQQQEQGQEEPQENPTMAFGGLYGNSAFRADSSVVPSNGFNNTLVAGSMGANPFYSPMSALSTMDNAPAQAMAGILGGVGALASSALGYSGLFNRKRHADDYQNYFQTKENQAQNIKTPTFNGTPPASTPRANEGVYPNKQNDIWNQFQKKKDPWSTWKPGMQTPDVPVAQYNNNAPISGASTNRLNGAPSMTMQQYGGLARAQEGLAINNMQDITTEYNPDAVMISTQGSYPASYQTSVKDVMPPMKVSRTDVNGNLLSPQELRANALDYRTQRNVIPEYNRLQRMFNWMEENNKSEKAWHKRNEKITKDNKEYIQQENVEGFDSKKNNNPPPCKGGKCTGLNREYGGELPHAQYGKDWSGQTGINNSPFAQNNFGISAQPSSKYYDTNLTGFQPGFGGQPTYNNHIDQSMSLSDADVANENNQGYKFPSYMSKQNPNSVNTHPKTIQRIPGEEIALNGLIGADTLNNSLGWFNQKSQNKANIRHFADTRSSNDLSYVFNPTSVHGNYTTNVQAGAPLQPYKHTAAQDYGTGISKYGGQQNFQSGGQYKVSHKELLQLLRDGAEIDFL